MNGSFRGKAVPPTFIPYDSQHTKGKPFSPLIKGISKEKKYSYNEILTGSNYKMIFFLWQSL